MKLSVFSAHCLVALVTLTTMSGCGDGRPPLPEGPSPDEAAREMILQEVSSLRSMVEGEGINAIRDLASVQEEQLSGINLDNVSSENEAKLSKALEMLKALGAEAATISASDLETRLSGIEQQLSGI